MKKLLTKVGRFLSGLVGGKVEKLWKTGMIVLAVLFVGKVIVDIYGLRTRVKLAEAKVSTAEINVAAFKTQAETRKAELAAFRDALAQKDLANFEAEARAMEKDKGRRETRRTKTTKPDGTVVESWELIDQYEQIIDAMHKELQSLKKTPELPEASVPVPATPKPAADAPPCKRNTMDRARDIGLGSLLGAAVTAVLL
jgi:hypothetical protein